MHWVQSISEYSSSSSFSSQRQNAEFMEQVSIVSRVWLKDFHRGFLTSDTHRGLALHLGQN